MSESSASVLILEREYKIACAPEDKALLAKAAALVDLRMRDVRQSQKTLSTERVAVLVALTLASELLKQGNADEIGEQLQALRAKVGAALDVAAA